MARRARQAREDLQLYQQKRLESVVRHAAGHSPFYRERLAGIVGEGPVELSRLPTLVKSEMMEHFDELVTDGRLRRDSLLGWVESLDHEELYLDRYRGTASITAMTCALFSQDWDGEQAKAGC